MSESLGSYQMFSPYNQGMVAVELFRELSDEHALAIHAQWRPILEERFTIAKLRYRQIANPSTGDWQKLLLEHGVPDANWDWRDLISGSAGRIGRASFYAESEGRIQAAMIVDLTRECRETSQTGAPLVYVDRLAVAPWNRKQIKDPEFLKGLGKIMLAVAVSLSLDEGWDGRVGLHALEQAEGFYRRCGMSELMADPHYEQLKYFEFLPAAARRFLE